MAETKLFIEGLDCIFLPAVDWSIIEQTLSDEDRAKYAQNGYPKMELDGLQYYYIPVSINGKGFKCVQGLRPEAIDGSIF